jgi:hypothetical protein
MSGSGGRCNGMGAKDVFPAEMPDDPTSTIDPLDDDTAERLLAGRLDPLDAPPPYAAVARLLQAAAAPPTPDELAGEPSALAAFRSRQPRPRPVPGRRSRSRLVAVALAGTLVAGGLWTAQGAALVPGRRFPTGGAAAGGSGSSASRLAGTGSGGSGAQGVGPGTLRVVRPQTGRAPARRPSAVPSAHDRVTGSHSGGAPARGDGPAHGARPHRPAKPAKPAKPKPAKPKPTEAKAKADNGAERK